MKTGSKIALLAAGAAALLLAKKQSVSGIGNVTMPGETISKARRLFLEYDEACDIERIHDAAVDLIYENLTEQGIDPYKDENEKIVINYLYRAGLTDENGLTDVSINRSNARKELLNYIYDNILPLFPLSKSDRDLLRNNINVVYQNRLLDLTRDLVKA